MPNFESPLGKKNFSGPAMREFDVPDESDYANQRPSMIDEDSIRQFHARSERQFGFSDDQELARTEQEIRAAREAKRTGKERLSENAKRRIDMLLGLTRSSREVTLEGNVFILRTLKSKEMREAITAVSDYDGTIQGPYEVRRQLLARSLTHVAGLDVDTFIGSTSFEAKLAFIDEMDETFSNRLYDEYAALVKQSRDKYAINSENEAKEVVEDLKKS